MAKFIVPEEVATEIEMLRSEKSERDTEITRLRAEVERLKILADINEQCALGYEHKQPFCEHENRFAYTDDGGKNGYCVMCRNIKLQAELEEARRANADWLRRIDAALQGKEEGK